MTSFFYSMLVTLFVLLLLHSARNSMVLRVRLAFFDDPACWPERYEALPSYDAMLYAPWYWHMWTTAQWRQFVDEGETK